MTKAIWVLIILVVGYVAYLLYGQWEKVQAERSGQQKQAVAATVSGDQLRGLPNQLEQSYRLAKEKGGYALHSWFKTYEKQLADPRKAWIELDLCVALARDNPAEAKKIFAGVKGRVPPSSPVWARVKELEKTYE